jgi:HAD superfamily hydrolase (TIGR01459 family)
MLESLETLADVEGRYDALLCDVWGVLHDGVEAFPGAVEALTGFVSRRGPVLLISNSSQPHHVAERLLGHVGVPRAAWTGVITSGDATRDLLAARRETGPAWAVGQPTNGAIYRGLDLTFTDDIDEAAFLSCTGLRDDVNDHPEDYRELFRSAAARGVPMICANPDIQAIAGGVKVWCGGSLARVYADLGGPVEMAGKPHPAIYDLAFRRLEAELGRPADRSRVLVVGDGAPTDIAGANAQGLDALFVAGGLHGDDFAGHDLAAEAQAFLKTSGVSATYLMRELA